MKKILLLCFGLGMPSMAAQIAEKPSFVLEVRFSAITNLIYQLDCMSEHLPKCGRENFRSLWANHLLRTAEDRKALADWKMLFARYNADFEFNQPEKFPAPLRYEGLHLSTKLRIASFQAASRDEYFSRLEILMTPKDRLLAEKVLRRFEGPFQIWWKKEAFKKGHSFYQKTKKELQRRDLKNSIDDFAKFYEAVIPDRQVIYFSLIYRPNEFAENTNATQIENYSVAEFLPTDTPEDRMDVIVHELCHYFFESSSDEKYASLKSAFEASSKSSSRGAFNLLNEALATAFGNGMISRLYLEKKQWLEFLKKDQSFYSNPEIDQAAKAILLYLDDRLRAKKSLYEASFVKEYLEVLEVSLGAKLTRPSLVLNEMTYSEDAKFGESLRSFVRSSLGTSSMYSSAGEIQGKDFFKNYRDNSLLSALFVVHSENLERFLAEGILKESSLEPLRLELKKRGRLLYSEEKAAHQRIFLVVASSGEDAKKLIQSLALAERAWSGLWAP